MIQAFINSGMVKHRENHLCVARVPPDIGVIQEEELSMAKAATPTTVTLKHMAAALAQAHEMAKKQSEMILGDFVSLMMKHLKKGDRLHISGLGILQVR